MNYISWSSDFALYLRPYQIEWHHTLDICQFDTMNDLILFAVRYLTKTVTNDYENRDHHLSRFSMPVCCFPIAHCFSVVSCLFFTLF